MDETDDDFGNYSENYDESSNIKKKYEKYDLLSVSNLTIRESLRKIINNCIDFGLLNKHMWIYGKCDNVYKLVSFKYDFNKGFIYPNPETITFYKSKNDNDDENIDYLKTLNDFVGAYYNDNEIHLIIFDCYGILKNLSAKFDEENSYSLLNNYNIKFTDVKIDTKTSINTYKTLQDYNFNTSIPMFLEHLSFETINGIKFKNNERIWKLLFKDDVCYISYKSLSKNIKDDTFNYYFRFNTRIFKVQLMNVNWNSDFEYFNINENTLKDEMIFELCKENAIIILSNEVGDYNKITLFKSQISKLSKCYLKNTRIYSQFSPFNVGFNFTNNFIEFIISLIIKNNITEITFETIYNFLLSTEVTDWMNDHKWTNSNKSIKELKSSYKLILNIIGSIENDSESLLQNNQDMEDDELISPLTFIATSPNTSIQLSKNGSPIISGLQYKLNTSLTWEDYEINKSIPLNNVDDYVQFRNKSNKLSTSSSDYVKFSINGSAECYGNIQSMINYSNSCSTYCFYNLFRNCTTLTKSPKLPIIELADFCYYNMFYGCSGLIIAPELPATTLADSCYNNMFRNCISLMEAPELPATTLTSKCYTSMFTGCSGLTVAPELPATELVDRCYQYMFSGCTLLSSIKVNFTDWNDSINATLSWMYNVSANGTFTCPSNLLQSRGNSKIPRNWDIISK